MKTIDSKVIGRLVQDEELDDWWKSEPIKIPLFGGHEIPFIFIDHDPAKDLEFLAETDAALHNFLQLDVASKTKLSERVYNNCMDFLEMVDYDEADDELRAIKDKDEIWNFVYPNEIYISRRHRRDKDIYVNINCDCDWEQEHGLQLVFRQGKQLTRISDIDGHLTEADAYDKPDAEDELLSNFNR